MILSTIKQLLGSKKAVVAVVTVLVALLGLFGLDLDADKLAAALSPLLAYIIGQGVADNGKEAAKEQTKTAELQLEAAKVGAQARPGA